MHLPSCEESQASFTDHVCGHWDEITYFGIGGKPMYNYYQIRVRYGSKAKNKKKSSANKRDCWFCRAFFCSSWQYDQHIYLSISILPSNDAFGSPFLAEFAPALSTSHSYMNFSSLIFLYNDFCQVFFCIVAVVSGISIQSTMLFL